VTTTDARPVGPERGADAQFAHWATVRRCALAAYLAALVAWSAYYGIPIQRELFERGHAVGVVLYDPDRDLVVLTDGKQALVQAENVVPLYRRNELTDRQLLAVNEVAGVLDTAALVEMRRQVTAGADPQAVADGWLGEHPLGR